MERGGDDGRWRFLPDGGLRVSTAISNSLCASGDDSDLAILRRYFLERKRVRAKLLGYTAKVLSDGIPDEVHWFFCL